MGAETAGGGVTASTRKRCVQAAAVHLAQVVPRFGPTARSRSGGVGGGAPLGASGHLSCSALGVKGCGVLGAAGRSTTCAVAAVGLEMLPRGQRGGAAAARRGLVCLSWGTVGKGEGRGRSWGDSGAFCGTEQSESE